MSFSARNIVLVAAAIFLPLTNGFFLADWFGGWGSAPVSPANSQDRQSPRIVMSVFNKPEDPVFGPVSFDTNAIPVGTDTDYSNSSEVIGTDPIYVPLQNSVESTMERILPSEAKVSDLAQKDEFTTLENSLKMNIDVLNTTTQAPQIVAAETKNMDGKSQVDKKETFNENCYNKYPQAICENYRLHGYCDSLKSRLAYYCEKTCGYCSNECFNEEKTCTQTESHCQPKFTHIPNEKCKALCGGCEVKLSREHHKALEAYKSLHHKKKQALNSSLSSHNISRDEASVEN